MGSVIDILRSRSAIKGAFEMDKRLRDIVTDEEMKITVTSGFEFENRALAEYIRKDVCVCLILNEDLESRIDHLITMEDRKGNTVGFDIPKDKADEYVDRTDIEWLSDDFAFVKGVEIGPDTKMVLHPRIVRSMDDIEGMKDPIIFYPSTTTDMILRRELGIESISDSTAILAFDLK